MSACVQKQEADNANKKAAATATGGDDQVSDDDDDEFADVKGAIPALDSLVQH